MIDDDIDNGDNNGDNNDDDDDDNDDEDEDEDDDDDDDDNDENDDDDDDDDNDDDLVAIPGDITVSEKETENVENYQELRWEVAKIWKMKEMKVIPIVIGSVSKSQGEWIDNLSLKIKTEYLQKNYSSGNGKDFKKNARVLATRRKDLKDPWLMITRSLKEFNGIASASALNKFLQQ